MYAFAMKSILLCLHGWGGSSESFTELREALKGSDIEVLAPDLPGFGGKPEPDRPWTTDDYAEWVITWLVESGKLKVESDWTLLGHSHGGRIVIKLLTQKLSTLNSQLSTPSHLFLCAPAGIRHPRHFKRIAGLLLAKTGTFFLSIPGMRSLQPLGKKLLYKLVRVHDYEKASPVMRETMIRVSAEDLRPLLSKITVPTDLFWGTEDGMTPYGDAKIMEREIPDAVLHTYPGVRHRVHRDRAAEIATIIKERASASHR